MTATSILIIVNAVAAIVLQAILPGKRHLIMASAATLALLLANNLTELLGSIAWETILMLWALSVYGTYIFRSNILDQLVKKLAYLSQGKQLRTLVICSLFVFCLSSVLNNYQTLMLIMPAIMCLLSLMPISKSYATLFFCSVLVLSNLGGAASPIGDTPALVLLASGTVSFGGYLVGITPIVLVVSLLYVVIIALYCRRSATAISSPCEEKMAVAYTHALYRRVRVHSKMLIAAGIVFCAMTLFWILGYNPTIVALSGLCALGICVDGGKFCEEQIKGMDYSVLVYFVCLFIVIKSVEITGIFMTIANSLLAIDSPILLLVAFAVIATLITAVAGAGPATVALLPVAESIRGAYPNDMVTVLCISICAGSSVFLTSATAGPLMQSLCDKNPLTIDGKTFMFDFKTYLPCGILSSALILLSTIIYILVML